MTDAAHSKWSPSSFARLMACPGSKALCDTVPPRTSRYADEGTAAHELGAMCLDKGKDATDYIGWTLCVRGDPDPKTGVCSSTDFTVTADMAEHVQTYIGTVRTYATGKTLLVEQRVHFGDWLGVPDSEAFGTADAVVLGDEDLTIIDLKFGMGVKVDVLDGAPEPIGHEHLNPQLMLYALGCLYEYEMLGDFKTVTMAISQPRLRHHDEVTIPVSELHRFALEGARPTVAKVKAARTSQQADFETYLQPGIKQCKFCDAKAICPALAAEVKDIVGGAGAADDFSNLDAPIAKTLTGPSLSAAMSAVPLVEEWCKATRAEVERRLFDGQVVPGYMLAEGKRGARQWTDDKAARDAGLVETKEVVLSPTQAEKKLKADPAKWIQLQPFIVQKPGAPSVVPTSEGKTPYSPQEVTAAAFTDLSAAADGHPFRD